jgi:uncharacterized membrane protein YhhN
MTTSQLLTPTGFAAALLLVCVLLGFVAALRGRISSREAWLIACAALATFSSVAGLNELHVVAKPLVMLLALYTVARARSAGPGRGWLLAALAGSLAGDCFLMVEGFFIQGLVSFLLAHLAYIALLRQDVPWFPKRAALAATLAVGAAMYAFLWAGGLPAALRLPVAVYVGVIALMAAQALGRAAALPGRSSTLVALGACCFMLSDSLLATNKFVQPLPMAQLWVLGSYYAAQLLIVGGWLRGAGKQPAKASRS